MARMAFHRGAWKGRQSDEENSKGSSCIFSGQSNTIKSPRLDAFLITAAESEVLYDLQTTQTFSSAPPELKTEMSSMYHQPKQCNTQTKRTPPPPTRIQLITLLPFPERRTGPGMSLPSPFIPISGQFN